MTLLPGQPARSGRQEESVPHRPRGRDDLCQRTVQWYAGNVEADVYFCPERHATYFGSFYMKDIPAMGNPNFSISTSLTGDSGEAFLAA